MGYLVPLTRPFGLSLLLALLLTPACRALALRAGFLDQPAARKIHGEPVPLLGGVAIYLAFASGLAASGPFALPMAGIIAGATVLMLAGLVDDGRGLAPWAKFLAQGAAAALAVAAGVRVDFPGATAVDIAITVLWMVGITNAFNLLDNMDGLSAGVALIAASAFGAIAARYADLGPEQLPTATAAAALAGACLGFLPYNLRAARIFMGDAGSMTLGFVLASLAAYGSWRSPTVPTSILIPLLVLAYPIFDTTLVVILRWRRGQSVFVGGRDHSSHRLVNLGLGKLETVLLIHLFAICHALTAVLVSSVTIRLSLIALGVSAAVLFIFGMVLRKAEV